MDTYTSQVPDHKAQARNMMRDTAIIIIQELTKHHALPNMRGYSFEPWEQLYVVIDEVRLYLFPREQYPELRENIDLFKLAALEYYA